MKALQPDIGLMNNESNRDAIEDALVSALSFGVILINMKSATDPKSKLLKLIQTEP